MQSLTIPLGEVDRDYLDQLRYAMTFASQEIASYDVSVEKSELVLEVAEEADLEDVRGKVDRLIQRFMKREFGLKSEVVFEQRRDLVKRDAWQELLDRRWVTPVGPGHVILRGPAAKLVSVIDAKVDRMFVGEFDAEEELYPNTILCKTLDRCAHFSSFPEHIDFVAHLREDVDVLNRFAETCKESGWAPDLHRDSMSDVAFAICPSCCYHCYEGMAGWELERPGRCTTMTVGCHRYEGANLTTLSRLQAFTMRELVWVGHPKYVMDCRARAEELQIEWAREWELDGTLESANDMFFTDDYAVKASFQRQQGAKRELRLTIPQEDVSISVFSSNFHATTFGKAFGIKVGGRPAASACLGWGFERWVYAIVSQFGLDVEHWPDALRREYEDHGE
ncbi:MAG: class-II aminoacyl-tRNA synthetase family protein [Planctomycetota bacterium]|jgi:seryl-tRNA synthetase